MRISFENGYESLIVYSLTTNSLSVSNKNLLAKGFPKFYEQVPMTDRIRAKWGY